LFLFFWLRTPFVFVRVPPPPPFLALYRVFCLPFFLTIDASPCPQAFRLPCGCVLCFFFFFFVLTDLSSLFCFSFSWTLFWVAIPLFPGALLWGFSTLNISFFFSHISWFFFFLRGMLTVAPTPTVARVPPPPPLTFCFFLPFFFVIFSLFRFLKVCFFSCPPFSRCGYSPGFRFFYLSIVSVFLILSSCCPHPLIRFACRIGFAETPSFPGGFFFFFSGAAKPLFSCHQSVSPTSPPRSQLPVLPPPIDLLILFSVSGHNLVVCRPHTVPPQKFGLQVYFLSISLASWFFFFLFFY